MPWFTSCLSSFFSPSRPPSIPLPSSLHTWTKKNRFEIFPPPAIRARSLPIWCTLPKAFLQPCHSGSGNWLERSSRKRWHSVLATSERVKVLRKRRRHSRILETFPRSIQMCLKSDFISNCCCLAVRSENFFPVWVLLSRKSNPFESIFPSNETRGRVSSRKKEIEKVFFVCRPRCANQPAGTLERGAGVNHEIEN